MHFSLAFCEGIKYIKIMKPNDRWNRLIAVLEAAGYADRQLADLLRQADKRPKPRKRKKQNRRKRVES